MIVRTWRGWTRRDDTEAYAEYILGLGIVEYKTTPGNEGAYLVSRPDGDRTEFLTISFWDNLDSIVAFAGVTVWRLPTLVHCRAGGAPVSVLEFTRTVSVEIDELVGFDEIEEAAVAFARSAPGQLVGEIVEILTETLLGLVVGRRRQLRNLGRELRR